jgi:hypothetical protein
MSVEVDGMSESGQQNQQTQVELNRVEESKGCAVGIVLLSHTVQQSIWLPRITSKAL